MATFENFTCKKGPNGKLDYVFCDGHYISRGHLKAELWGNLTEPINDVWLHVVSYQMVKTTYEKFAVDIWGSLCDWMSKKSKSYILDWSLGLILQFTNINHPCPYDGVFFVNISNISVEYFHLEPFIPSGRYRMDINLTEGKQKNVFFISHLYFNLSEKRNDRRFG